MFIVLAGKATVVLGDEERLLGPGEVIYLSPFDYHEIRNTSDEPFDIVSIYWENIPSAVEALAQRPPRDRLPERTLVFCPPATPNGGLHLGHLAGPYVRADMLVRALRSMGRGARYVTGTDDHQSHVAAVRAAARGGPGRGGHGRGRRHAGDAAPRPASAATGSPVPLADPGHADRIRELFARGGRLARRLGAGAGDGLLPPLRAVAVPGVRTRILRALRHVQRRGDLRGLRPAQRGAGTGRPAVPDLRRAGRHPPGAGAVAGPRLLRRPAAGLPAAPATPRPTCWPWWSGCWPRGCPRYRLSRSSEWGVALGDGQVLDAWADLALTFLDAARAESEQDGPARSRSSSATTTASSMRCCCRHWPSRPASPTTCPPRSSPTSSCTWRTRSSPPAGATRSGPTTALAAAGPDADPAGPAPGRAGGTRHAASPGSAPSQLTQDPLYLGAQEWLAGFAAAGRAVRRPGAGHRRLDGRTPRVLPVPQLGHRATRRPAAPGVVQRAGIRPAAGVLRDPLRRVPGDGGGGAPGPDAGGGGAHQRWRWSTWRPRCSPRWPGRSRPGCPSRSGTGWACPRNRFARPTGPSCPPAPGAASAAPELDRRRPRRGWAIGEPDGVPIARRGPARHRGRRGGGRRDHRRLRRASPGPPGGVRRRDRAVAAAMPPEPPAAPAAWCAPTTPTRRSGSWRCRAWPPTATPERWASGRAPLHAVGAVTADHPDQEPALREAAAADQRRRWHLGARGGGPGRGGGDPTRRRRRARRAGGRLGGSRGGHRGLAGAGARRRRRRLPRRAACAEVEARGGRPAVLTDAGSGQCRRR